MIHSVRFCLNKNSRPARASSKTKTFAIIAEEEISDMKNFLRPKWLEGVGTSVFAEFSALALKTKVFQLNEKFLSYNFDSIH
jgi:hypothetical protein